MTQPTPDQALADQAQRIIDTTPALASLATNLPHAELVAALSAAGVTGDRVTVAHVRRAVVSCARVPGDVLECEGREGWWIVTDLDGGAVHAVICTISTSGAPYGRDVLTTRYARVPQDGVRPAGTAATSSRNAMRWILHHVLTDRYTPSSDSDPAAAQLAAAVLAARSTGAALQD